MLQVHLFDRILKLNANKNLPWNSIDATKLQEDLLELATVAQRYKADRQAKSFELIGHVTIVVLSICHQESS